MSGLTSQMVKDYAKALGADLVGISPMDRFDGAPKQQDPRYIFPKAKSCIVLAFRVPRGYYRGIEEGTYWAAYTGLGYGGINTVYGPIVIHKLCCFIEDFGAECAPVPNIYPGSSVAFGSQQFEPRRSIPVAPGKPNPDILVDFRIAAYCAGLGQFGYSKVFLTPEFGPFQRFVVLLTDAELEPDPIYEGKLCDKCMLCTKACTGNAISATETTKITVAGHEIEFGKFDAIACSKAYMGEKPEYNPFLSKEGLENELPNWYCGAPKLFHWTGYNSHLGNNPAIEGARGCMRECYAHLEKRGVLTRKFDNPFREPGQKPWRINPEWRKQYQEENPPMTVEEIHHVAGG